MKTAGLSRAAILRALQTYQGFMTAGDGVGVELGTTELPLVVFG
jgi:hypothetical protein